MKIIRQIGIIFAVCWLSILVEKDSAGCLPRKCDRYDPLVYLPVYRCAEN